MSSSSTRPDYAACSAPAAGPVTAANRSRCAESAPKCVACWRSPAPPSTSRSRAVVHDTAVLGPVVVRLPPDPSLSRVLRLTASGVAAMAGYSVDEIDDIRIAVSEVLLALIEHGAGGLIEVELAFDGDAFVVRAHTPIESFDTEHPDLALCRTVLAGVCTSHGIELINDEAHIWAAVAHTPHS